MKNFFDWLIVNLLGQPEKLSLGISAIEKEFASS
jgi:hypothetical protein